MAKSFFKLFPPPRYLAMPAVGVDLSDRSLKYAEVARGHAGYSVVKRFGEQAIPAGALVGGQIKQPEVLVGALREVAAHFATPYIIASLPEEEAYIVELALPPMPRRELASSIELQLEEYVPLKASETVFDYEVITAPSRASGGYSLVVSAFPRALAEGYYNVFKSAGLVPLAFEVEGQAMARAVVPRSAKGTCIVVDFGRTRTSFFVVSRGKVSFTLTVPTIAGDEITRSISKELNISIEEADKRKVERGLLGAREDQALAAAILPVLSVLRDEITKLVGYWSSHAGDVPTERVEQVILCGGQVTLPGLLGYLSSAVSLPMTLADVWSNIAPVGALVPPVPYRDSFRYATALGLALRNPAHWYD